ncbi:hypothetical protein [Chitinimonas lacunae]|uniref:DUF3617 family protein n=1 Tax=Chitinimonas lacunae TaxID=1963018 RepID=A0ABV8MMT4_9NEIS
MRSLKFACFLALTCGVAFAAPGKVDMKNQCGNGTRTVTGGYDADTGVMDVTIKLENCQKEGGVHSGTTTLKGTMKLDGTSKTKYTMNLTETIDTKVTYKFRGPSAKPEGEEDGVLVRKCTITRVGTYETRSDIFDGKISRTDCTLEGAVRDRLGLVEGLLRRATTPEEH